MNKKIIAVLVLGIALGTIIGLFIRVQKPLTIWGGSKINLAKLGDPVGGEYKGGIWRIFGETSGVSSTVHFLKFDQDIVKSVGFEYNDKTYYSLKDVGISAIMSDIQVEIWQEQNPYWSIPWIPWKPVPTVTVCPEMYGFQRDWNTFGYWYTKLDDVFTEPLVVDIYQLDFDKAKLYVPITMYATKYAGESAPVTLRCKELDDMGAYDPTRNVYTVALSEWHYGLKGVNDTETRTFNFYNPKNEAETLKIDLKFSFGAVEGSQYPFGKDNIFAIVPHGKSLPASTYFIFRVNDFQTSVLPILNGWQTGAYYNKAYFYYWFGDTSENGLFKGNTIHYEDEPYSRYYLSYGKFSNVKIDSTTYQIPAVEFMSGLYSQSCLIAEGYGVTGYDNPAHFPVYDYPGWYTPKTDVKDWFIRRYPFQPQYDVTTTEGNEWDSNESILFTRPSGLSLLDYISATQIRVPQKATVLGSNFTSNFVTVPKNEFAPRIEHLNSYYDNEWADGVVPTEPLRVFLDLDARHWFYTIDISTELADTYVVQENYLNVQIENPSVSDTELDYKETCTITMDLKNTLNLNGSAWLALQVSGGSIGVDSGLGKIIFGANEIKYNYTVVLRHVTLIEEDITVNCVLYAWNGEKRTSEFSFSLLLHKSFGVQNTKVKVVALTTDNKPIADITGKVIFGGIVRYSQTYTGSSGELIIDLGQQYRGDATVEVWDIDDRYERSSQTKYVSPETDNTFTFHLKLKGEEGVDWEKYLPYIIGGIVAVAGLGVGVYMYRKRQYYGGPIY